MLTRLRSEKKSPVRPTELAEGWDRIEADLRDPDVWAFLSRDSEEQRPTRISLLLDALAGSYEGLARPPFHTFDQLQARVANSAEGAAKLWQEVLDLHGLLTGWYADRGVFHKVGYLVAVGVPFAELVNLARGCAKSAFEQRLVDRIRHELGLSATSPRSFSMIGEPKPLIRASTWARREL